jgi:hypothetical protein
VVTLGGRQFYRYFGLSPGGSSETVYALPTNSGTVLAACQLQGSQPSFNGDCERVLGKLTVLGATALPLGPRQSVATQLSGVINALNAAVSTGQTRLRSAGKAAAQATAAGQLATAYEQAAANLQKTPTGPAEATTVKSLAAALAKIGTDYKSLEAAASHNNAGKYNAARQTIANDGTPVSAQLTRLGQFGYAGG